MKPWVLASEVDFIARVGRFSDTDRLRVESAIEDASALVLHEAGDPAWTIETVPPAVHTVVLEIARRKFTNPDDLVNETSGEGPYNRGQQRAATAVGVYLTPTEAKIVRRYRAGAGSGLWSQRITRGDDVDTTLWIDGFGSEPFPIGTLGEYGQ